MSRDLFADLSSRDASEPETPMVAAQEAMKPALIKRFYDAVELKPDAGGYHILLDGRPVKTPQRNQLFAPHAAAAERLQAEWAAQETDIDPGLMPLTRLLNAAIDGVRERRLDTASQIAEYLNSDLVCYRAEGPDRLVAKQAGAWQPVLRWSRKPHPRTSLARPSGVSSVRWPAPRWIQPGSIRCRPCPTMHMCPPSPTRALSSPRDA